MRLGVLDIGSNTGHLLVVDAHRGAAPLPAYSHKSELRLAEHIGSDGALARVGVNALISFIGDALDAAEDKGCESVTAFATSAVRDASNVDGVVDKVRVKTGVDLRIMSGSEEAKLTFLAVRRWFGWSSGCLLVFDIGGGSLEIAAGADEFPEVEQSLPLGAGRLTREWLPGDPPSEPDVKALRRHIRASIAADAGTVLRSRRSDHFVATSKTFRSLARICGAAPSAEGPMVRRVLGRAPLRSALPRLRTNTVAETAALPGVSTSRAHQILAGALVADAVMDIFDIAGLEVCPWALREGVILEKLDQL